MTNQNLHTVSSYLTYQVEVGQRCSCWLLVVQKVVEEEPHLVVEEELSQVPPVVLAAVEQLVLQPCTVDNIVRN